MKRQIAAIEFGTSKIVTVVADNAGADRLRIAGSGTVPYDGFSGGDWNTPRQMIQKVRDSIAAAEMESGIKIRELYVGVPGEYIHVYPCEAEVEVPDGKIDDSVVNAVMDAAAEYLNLSESGSMVLHRSPAWFIVDDGKKTMNPEGPGTKLRAQVSFIVAESVFIEDVSEMLGALNISILGFLAPSLGASFLLLSIEDRDRVSVLIDCGYLNTEISVVEGDAIVYHAILPSGAGHVTAELAQNLRLTMRAAEEIKRKYVFNPDEYDRNSFVETYDELGNRITFPRDVISEKVEGSFEELLDMIDMTLKNDAAPFLTSRSQVFLTGGGLALMRGGREHLSAKIGLPVKTAVAKTSELTSPVFSSALGLADLVFDSIEQNQPVEESVGGKLRNLFKGKK